VGNEARPFGERERNGPISKRSPRSAFMIRSHRSSCAASNAAVSSGVARPSLRRSRSFQARARRPRGEYAARESAGIFRRFAEEAEGDLPMVQKEQVSLPECAPREKLHGSTGALSVSVTATTLRPGSDRPPRCAISDARIPMERPGQRCRGTRSFARS
jgi:hypothetical protein